MHLLLILEGARHVLSTFIIGSSENGGSDVYDQGVASVWHHDQSRGRELVGGSGVIDLGHISVPRGLWPNAPLLSLFITESPKN
jgi:hypothetical protein